MNAPTRPALRWHGGKWRLAPWIISHFPPHRTYVEPYGGAASVLLRKPRAYAEVYNDLDDEVVNLFRVLRDEAMADRLLEMVQLTPFARAEFEEAYQPTDEPVERARRLMIRSFFGFGSNANAGQRRGHRSTGFRKNTTRAGTTPATDWRTFPDHIPALIERLRGVVIEHRPALRVVDDQDGPDTLVYADPPYMHATRSAVRYNSERGLIYAHEMDDAQHEELLAHLLTVESMVVLSGYACPLYENTLASWRRVETETHADGAKPRTEVLWINPRAAAALEAQARGGPLMDWALA